MCGKLLSTRLVSFPISLHRLFSVFHTSLGTCLPQAGKHLPSPGENGANCLLAVTVASPCLGMASSSAVTFLSPP